MNFRTVVRYSPLAVALLFSLISSGTLTAQTYPRIVLIEEFTSATCNPCVQATPIMNAMVNNNPGKVFSIRYHMNFPVPGDPMYSINSTDNEARRSYYLKPQDGIPQARVNGGDHNPAPTDNPAMTATVSDELKTKSTLKIEPTHSIEGGVLKVNVKVTADNDGLSGSTYVLRVAVLEKHVVDPSTKNLAGSNGETEFYDVMRVLLPNAQGQTITLNANEYKTYSTSTPLNVKWNTGELFVVAFVQEEYAPYPILQAGASSPTSSVRNAPVQADIKLKASPNPSCGSANLNFSLSSSETVNIELYSVTGTLVKKIDQGTMEAGEHAVQLDTRDLPSGIYRCVLVAGQRRESVMLSAMRQ